jgi:hypothetical protein
MAREMSDQPVADVGAASIGNAFTREYLNEINRTVQPPVHHVAADPDVGDSWTKTAARVGGLLGYGALDELRYRPANVAFSGLGGLAMGFGATVLAAEFPVAVGVAGLAAAGYGLYQLASNAPRWYHDAKMVANPSRYSGFEVASAKDDLHRVGGASLDVAAGAIGGYAGARLASSQLAAPVREWLKDRVGTVRYDEMGRPTRLSALNRDGAARITYDADGNIVGFKETTWGSERSNLTSVKQPDGTLKWTSTASTNGVEMQGEWHGSLTLSPDKAQVTMADGFGTRTYRVDGHTAFRQTAAQAAREAEFFKTLNQLADRSDGTAAGGITAAARVGALGAMRF